MIEKCIEKIEHYSKKVEIHMEKISSVLDESESEFTDTVLSDDSQICADAMECCIDFKQLKKGRRNQRKKKILLTNLHSKQILIHSLICKISY